MVFDYNYPAINVAVDTIGEDKEAKDALAGSGNDLKICRSELYIFKTLCPDGQEAIIISISYTVTMADSVKVYFIDSASNVVDSQTVSACFSLGMLGNLHLEGNFSKL